MTPPRFSRAGKCSKYQKVGLLKTRYRLIWADFGRVKAHESPHGPYSRGSRGFEVARQLALKRLSGPDYQRVRRLGEEHRQNHPRRIAT
jgi:hypothetical protein